MEFTDLVKFTCNKELTDREQLANAVIGLMAESAEAGDIVKKYLYQGHNLDIPKLKKEIADTLWYLNLLLIQINSTEDECKEIGIKKLLNRYPNGFDAHHSVNRVPEAEELK